MTKTQKHMAEKLASRIMHDRRQEYADASSIYSLNPTETNLEFLIERAREYLEIADTLDRITKWTVTQ